MKKIYILGLLVVTTLSVGQVTNGNLELWDNPTMPTSFVAAFTNGTAQEATIKRTGSFSAKHTPTPAVSPATGFASVKIQNETTTIIAGNNYTISYWYLDNDPLAKARPWIYWLDSANMTITDTPSSSTFRPGTYTTDSPQWMQFTASFTAPAGAVKLRFEMRTYADGVGATTVGSVYYDDMSVINNGVLKINQNSIAGLEIYPNPVNGNILNITTEANASKNVVIFDVLGKQVLNVTTDNTTVNVGNLNAGVYIVKITEEGKTATRKLVIQ